jgi:hypothetical protein
MAKILAPRLLRRGVEIFAVISLIGFGGILFYGDNLNFFLETMLSLRWEWLLLGVLVASMDWIGGGIRLFVLLRHVFPTVKLKSCILSAGLNAWGTMITPSQAGGGPAGIFSLKRSGVPIPEGTVATFMSWVATVLFFSVAGPLTIWLGAGQSLEAHGVLGDLSLNDLYRLSLGAFVTVGLAILVLLLFPGLASKGARAITRLLEKRGNERLAGRIEQINAGIDRMHGAMVTYFKGKGWLALGWAVVFTGVAYSNKLVAGYIVLRVIGIEANFVDVLLLQTLIIFVLYFAPTPGGSGLAEVLSVAVMSIYVSRELAPSYILIWRVLVSYLTVGFGSFVFWRWLKLAEDAAKEAAEDEGAEKGLETG